MRRREFITLFGGAAAAWPLAARAQQPTLPVVGFLNSASAEGYASMAAAFGQGLREAGYVDGTNVIIEYRWAQDQYDRLPSLAADLVSRRVALIFANSPAIPHAKAATSMIPIVFMTGDDPVRLGFVASFNRPGGNLTGVSILSGELAAKRLRLLRDLIPQAKLIAVLVNSDFGPTRRFQADIETTDISPNKLDSRLLVANLLELGPGEPLGPVLFQLSFRLLKRRGHACDAHHIRPGQLHAVDRPEPLRRDCKLSLVNSTDA
jgi:ABC-type uncharacterized transport system substrate-binding protein